VSMASTTSTYCTRLRAHGHIATIGLDSLRSCNFSPAASISNLSPILGISTRQEKNKSLVSKPHYCWRALQHYFWIFSSGGGSFWSLLDAADSVASSRSVGSHRGDHQDITHKAQVDERNQRDSESTLSARFRPPTFMPP